MFIIQFRKDLRLSGNVMEVYLRGCEWHKMACITKCAWPFVTVIAFREMLINRIQNSMHVEADVFSDWIFSPLVEFLTKYARWHHDILEN